MKINEVKVGEVYATRCSGTLVVVRVLAEVPPRRAGAPRAFRGARLRTGEELPKPRTAAALRASGICRRCRAKITEHSAEKLAECLGARPGGATRGTPGTTTLTSASCVEGEHGQCPKLSAPRLPCDCAYHRGDR